MGGWKRGRRLEKRGEVGVKRLVEGLKEGKGVERGGVGFKRRVEGLEEGKGS